MDTAITIDYGALDEYIVVGNVCREIPFPNILLGQQSLVVAR